MRKATEAEGGRSARADERVAWVLDAAHQLLEAEGPEHLTVQRIAERAGVSVGSLYRHFPSKEAVVAAVFRRDADRALESSASVENLFAERSLPELLHALVAASVARYERMMRLHPTWVREHLEEVNLARFRPEGRARTRRVAELMLLHYRHELRDDLDLETALFLLSVGLNSLVQAATRERPRLLGSPAFRSALAELALRFLMRDPARPPGDGPHA